MEVTPLELTRRRVRMADFVELTKPRITFLVLITTLVGFYMGSRDGLNFLLLFHTILGTALVASGASALNQYFERDLDARMVRTRRRPLPDGRLVPNEALVFSAAISVAGVLYLMFVREPADRRHRRCDSGGIHSDLHAAQDTHNALHPDRRLPRRSAARDGMDGGARRNRRRRLVPFRDSVSLADAALFCDRMDFH